MKNDKITLNSALEIVLFIALFTQEVSLFIYVDAIVHTLCFIHYIYKYLQISWYSGSIGATKAQTLTIKCTIVIIKKIPTSCTILIKRNSIECRKTDPIRRKYTLSLSLTCTSNGSGLGLLSKILSSTPWSLCDAHDLQGVGIHIVKKKKKTFI